MSYNEQAEKLQRVLRALQASRAMELESIEGIRLWPLVQGYLRLRIWLKAGIFAETYEQGSPSTFDEAALAAAERKALAMIDELPSLGQRGCLSFSMDFDSRIVHEGGRYHQFLDPVYEQIAAVEPSLCLETSWAWQPSTDILGLWKNQQPRALPSCYLDSYPFAARARQRAAVWSQSPLCLELTELLRREGLAMNDQAPALDIADFSFFLGIYDMGRRVLLRVRPRFLLVCGVYSSLRAGMIAAARSLGIMVVNVADAPLSNSPLRFTAEDIPFRYLRDGHTLPHCWWLVTQDCKRSLSARQPYYAEHIFVGNAWRAKSTASAADILPKLPPAKQRVLVTLKGGGQLPRFLLDAMRQRQDGIVWHLRLHPSNLQERLGNGWQPGPVEHSQAHNWNVSRGYLAEGEKGDPIGPLTEELLHSLGITSVEIRESSQQPLYALLAHIQHHVTCCSTTLVDAAEAGVETSLTHALGVEWFAGHIQAGTVKPCASEAELLAHLDASLERPASDKAKALAAADHALKDEVLRLLRATGMPEPSSLAEVEKPAAIALPPAAPATAAQAVAMPLPQRLSWLQKLTMRFAALHQPPKYCPACQGKRWHSLAGLAASSAHAAEMLHVCESCGLVARSSSALAQPTSFNDEASSLRDLLPWLTSVGCDLSHAALPNSLDYGCGGGAALTVLAGAGRKIWGVEVEASRAAQASNDITIKPSLDALPEGLDFDFIFSRDALACEAQPRALLKFAKQRLKRQRGRLLLILPTWRGEDHGLASVAWQAGQQQLFDHLSLAQLLASAGFELVAWRYRPAAAPRSGVELCALARKAADAPALDGKAAALAAKQAFARMALVPASAVASAAAVDSLRASS